VTRDGGEGVDGPPPRPSPGVRALCLAAAGAALLGSLVYLLFGGHRGAGIAMAAGAVLLTRILLLNVARLGRP
jgi:hypothetical protein